MSSRLSYAITAALCSTAACTAAVCLAVGTSAASAAAAGPATVPIIAAEQASAVLNATSTEKLGPVYAQGVARVDDGWIVSGRNTLARLGEDLSNKTVFSQAIPTQWAEQGFNHIGDIDVAGDLVYAALEQPDYGRGEQATAWFDATTLEFVGAVTVPQHENSFITVDPETMIAYSMDNFSGNALMRYQVDDNWRALEALQMDQEIQNVQGVDIAGGSAWLSSDVDETEIFRVDLVTGNAELIGSAGHLGGEAEGIDATELASGLIHILTIDPKLSPVWFDHFEVNSPGPLGGTSLPPIRTKVDFVEDVSDGGDADGGIAIGAVELLIFALPVAALGGLGVMMVRRKKRSGP